jgi:glycosyltransferase involved in cell wall biosynthesis
MASLPATSVDERLAFNRRNVERLTSMSVAAFHANRYRTAASLAAIAADFAWHHHSGIFVSPVLEDLARALANHVDEHSVLTGSCLGFQVQGERPAMLHVITEAYAIGGHTRLASRWIGFDRSHVHSVALTRKTSALPRDLVESVESSGGLIFELPQAGHERDLLHTAGVLAGLAPQYSLLALHTHPNDVVPSIACSVMRGQGPPVLFVNHADHVFWLGASIADLYICFRRSGSLLANRRRGIAIERLREVPLPLLLPERSLDQRAAKAGAGLSPDDVLLLTIASSYKYESAVGLDFLDLVCPVIDKMPQVRLLAIGPLPKGRWREVERQSGGRIRALGPIQDPILYREAADVYLDPSAFGSITSLLESAALGTACLAFTPDRRPDSVLYSDPPGTEDGLLRGQTIDEYRGLLHRLINDPAYRSESGAMIAASVRETYAPDRWEEAINRVYESAQKGGSNGYQAAGFPAFHEVDRELAALASRRGTASLPVALGFAESKAWTDGVPLAQGFATIAMKVFFRLERLMGSHLSRRSLPLLAGVIDRVLLISPGFWLHHRSHGKSSRLR